VYGANFVSGAVVNWNYQPRSTTFISARELQAQILSSDIATPTAGYITVSNPAPGGGNSASYAQVEVHAPTATIVANQPANYNFGWYGLYPADFNGDGKLDLLGPGPGGINLRLGNGDGTFRFGSIAGRHYHYITPIVYGDFNGDGKIDIAYVMGDSQLSSGKQILVMLGDGTGKFTLGSKLTSWSGFGALTVGDFNGDGKLDLVAVHGQNFEIYLGNGDGSFTPFKTYPVPGPAHQYVVGEEMVAADFNGDGKLDLLSLDQYGDGYVLLGRGDGTFVYPGIAAPFVGLGCGVHSTLVVTDFNGDGKPDLALCNADQIGILLGNGDGTFQPPGFYAGGPSFEIATGDFNSDGKTDIVISRNDNFQFLFLPGNGDGTFQPEQAVTLPVSADGSIGMAVGDFNADGLLDFVLVEPNGTAVVFTQQ
jgi:FG-GAP-like repeat